MAALLVPSPPILPGPPSEENITPYASLACGGYLPGILQQAAIVVDGGDVVGVHLQRLAVHGLRLLVVTPHLCVCVCVCVCVRVRVCGTRVQL